MEPITVEVRAEGSTLTQLNCGTILTTETLYWFTVHGQSMTLDRDLTPDPLAAAQRFADLLSDVTK